MVAADRLFGLTPGYLAVLQRQLTPFFTWRELARHELVESLVGRRVVGALPLETKIGRLQVALTTDDGSSLTIEVRSRSPLALRPFLSAAGPRSARACAARRVLNRASSLAGTLSPPHRVCSCQFLGRSLQLLGLRVADLHRTILQPRLAQVGGGSRAGTPRSAEPVTCTSNFHERMVPARIVHELTSSRPRRVRRPPRPARRSSLFQPPGMPRTPGPPGAFGTRGWTTRSISLIGVRSTIGRSGSMIVIDLW